jgi:hypothetical protein
MSRSTEAKLRNKIKSANILHPYRVDLRYLQMTLKNKNAFKMKLKHK